MAIGEKLGRCLMSATDHQTGGAGFKFSQRELALLVQGAPVAGGSTGGSQLDAGGLIGLGNRRPCVSIICEFAGNFTARRGHGMGGGHLTIAMLMMIVVAPSIACHLLRPERATSGARLMPTPPSPPATSKRTLASR